MGWQTGEEEFISGVFGDEHSAEVYAERMEYEDEYNYQYKVHEWEVKWKHATSVTTMQNLSDNWVKAQESGILVVLSVVVEYSSIRSKRLASFYAIKQAIYGEDTQPYLLGGCALI